MVVESGFIPLETVLKVTVIEVEIVYVEVRVNRKYFLGTAVIEIMT